GVAVGRAGFQVSRPVTLEGLGPGDGCADVQSKELGENWSWEVSGELGEHGAAGGPGLNSVAGQSFPERLRADRMAGRAAGEQQTGNTA
ncbi:hypothetical protein, partial [Amycolatopsis sp. NPDC058986]|uniref:hypothetical protein n=1 Tax=unclassified Amycolatopsis TaxID=2618356 RepID=UPI0036717CDB